MPLSEPITPGTVDWTGENPGILLKDDSDGFAAMALFFRVAWSPVGQGHALLLYASPAAAEAPADAPNVLLADNLALAEFLRDGFIARLAAFRQAPAFGGLRLLEARAAAPEGDPMGGRYAETMTTGELAVQLVWEDLEAPMALELSPDQVGTRAHTMFTLLVPARRAAILVNGRPLPGHVGKRVQAGMETTTAFLYFSETWIIPPAAANG
ncbi:MAG: hypothetical protein GC150_16905 [Rhizobiales bacterium]|nr:hypothetical protein [Hyphomicrobiales bacterium]